MSEKIEAVDLSAEAVIGYDQSLQTRGTMLAMSAQWELRHKWGYEGIDIRFGEVPTDDEGVYALLIHYQGEGFYICMKTLDAEWQNDANDNLVGQVCRSVRSHTRKEAVK